jgi:hypothetical protein
MEKMKSLLTILFVKSICNICSVQGPQMEGGAMTGDQTLTWYIFKKSKHILFKIILSNANIPKLC